VSERAEQRPIGEQRFFAVLGSLDRGRHLIGNAVDELIKANQHLKSLRVAAWLIVWLISLLAARFWR